MKYGSSRGQYSSITAAEAIKMGMAPDGGLFVPDYIPRLNKDDWQLLVRQNYQQRAYTILGYFLEDFTADEIKNCVDSAYNRNNFDNKEIAPLIQLGIGVYIQELWHGPTSAFKDMALQLLPHLMVTSAQKTGENDEIVILVATSGDTGKAALEGFKDVDRVKIIVFYPQDGVSQVQKQQMITQTGQNVYVAAVEGNFDDAQNGVKKIFADQQFISLLAARGMKMSSANSINWGRLLPQIVYYVSAYVDLLASGKVKAGDAINIVVPTGNFGNILAAFYAGQMGVPVNRLICASNANNVLTEFIRSGVYDRQRTFFRTISPSMDILVSSNLERLLFETTGHNSHLVANWMEDLGIKGAYEVNEEVKQRISQLFWADFSSDEETRLTIRQIWQQKGYLLDTHTAVAYNVYSKYQQSTGDGTTTVIASTASPFKFAQSVAEAILPAKMIEAREEFKILEELAQYTGIDVPAALQGLADQPILHKTVCSPETMEQAVAKFLDL